MNRFTRYCMEKHGLKPEACYPWTPYEIDCNIILEAVEHNAEHCVVKQYLNIGTSIVHIARDGSIDWTDFD